MRRALDEICRWFMEGRIKPHVSATFPLEQTADALKLLLARKSIEGEIDGEDSGDLARLQFSAKYLF